MAVLKFRFYWEEDESIYRDIEVIHTQTFFALHESLLKSFEFDNKHKATFFRSNDNWQSGKEISVIKYEGRDYKAEPLIMQETKIASEIKDTNQRFRYLYDFEKKWSFLVELIQIEKNENFKLSYPNCARKEGLAPSQYGTKSIIDSKLNELEEKLGVDLEELGDGFGEEDADGNATTTESESFLDIEE